ncbi:hypothetical protein ACFVJK_14040 [Streptomyces sp. NPDC127172]|uniref:hypothetical protein n=1 Tax=Streptomyces sp. NPDC127172 TaxID=3345382 RepID=UPI0036368D17
MSRKRAFLLLPYSGHRRNDATDAGRWSSSVAEHWTSYVRPQENGDKRLQPVARPRISPVTVVGRRTRTPRCRRAKAVRVLRHDGALLRVGGCGTLNWCDLPGLLRRARLEEPNTNDTMTPPVL